MERITLEYEPENAFMQNYLKNAIKIVEYPLKNSF